MYVLQVVVECFVAVTGWFWQIITALWSFLGIGDAIAKNALYFLILAALWAGPLYLSRRDKQKAKKIANVAIEIVSFLRRK